MFVNLRRISSVPELPLPVRTRFGAAALDTQGETSDALIVLLRSMGLERFSGPGAPNRAPAAVSVAVVSAKTKSFSGVALAGSAAPDAKLLFVS